MTFPIVKYYVQLSNSFLIMLAEATKSTLALILTKSSILKLLGKCLPNHSLYSSNSLSLSYSGVNTPYLYIQYKYNIGLLKS